MEGVQRWVSREYKIAADISLSSDIEQAVAKNLSL